MADELAFVRGRFERVRLAGQESQTTEALTRVLGEINAAVHAMIARGEKPSRSGLTYEDRKRWREAFWKGLMVCAQRSHLKPSPRPIPVPAPGPNPDPDSDPDPTPDPRPDQVYVLPSRRERGQHAGEAGDAADQAWLPYMLRWINSGGIKVIFDRDEEDRAREEAEEARRRGAAADHEGGVGGEGGEGGEGGGGGRRGREGENEKEEEEEQDQDQDQDQEVSGFKKDRCCSIV